MTAIDYPSLPDLILPRRRITESVPEWIRRRLRGRTASRACPVCKMPVNGCCCSSPASSNPYYTLICSGISANCGRYPGTFPNVDGAQVADMTSWQNVTYVIWPMYQDQPGATPGPFGLLLRNGVLQNIYLNDGTCTTMTSTEASDILFTCNFFDNFQVSVKSLSNASHGGGILNRNRGVAGMPTNTTPVFTLTNDNAAGLGQNGQMVVRYNASDATPTTSSASFTNAGGSGSISVTSATAYTTWYAAVAVSDHAGGLTPVSGGGSVPPGYGAQFVHITSATTGFAPSTITYTVDANGTGLARSNTIEVNSFVFLISQAA